MFYCLARFNYGKSFTFELDNKQSEFIMLYWRSKKYKNICSITNACYYYFGGMCVREPEQIIKSMAKINLQLNSNVYGV